MTPVAVVQEQLDAYNARDLDRFVDQYADDVREFHPPRMEPVISGKTAFRAYYAEKRFVLPGLRAEVSSRMSLGGTVVDYEHIHGIGDEVLKGIAVYEVVNGKIQNVWFFSP